MNCMHRFRRPVLAVIAVLTALSALAPAASAAVTRVPPGMPPAGKVMLGLGGNAIEPRQFDAMTGGTHDLFLITIPWNEARTWNEALDKRLAAAKATHHRLMVHIGTQRVDNGREGRSPGAVARGVADGYFLDMGRVLNASGQIVYLRPPAEMNGHWNHWAAFNANGSRRNADHSTLNYRRAFIRMTLIARGGDVARINVALRNNGMPPLRTAAAVLPSSGKIATVFNPQGRGAPDRRGNQPIDYYPGKAWVDYAANDLYAQSGRVNWKANEEFYARFAPSHPFIMAEYAPWGYDDPAFVKRMFAWASTHRRVVGLVYFNGTGGTSFRLATKPRTLAAYKVLARGLRYRCAALGPFTETC
ncbi:MAG: hypothetical protein JWM86_117 [Thermoleophilia bacterium]|nr:hypothetical protein [Thermoleophilia bacterium]